MEKHKSAKIDVHQHMLPDVYITALAKLGIEGAGGVKFPEWRSDTALQMMDDQGIGVGMLSISSPGVHFGDDKAAEDLSSLCNEYSASLIEGNPQRFGGFAILPMPFVEGARREAIRALDELKLDGVVLLSSHSDGSYLGDPRFDSLLEVLNERSAKVFVHPTVPVSSPNEALTIPTFATEFVFDTSRAIANLVWSGAAERFPNIRFIFSHAGGTAPYLAWRWSLLDLSPQMQEKAPKGFIHYLRNFYYDTALSGSDYALGALTKLVSSDHILYGSDFPFAPAVVGAASEKGVNEFVGFSESDREGIASNNAIQLFERLSKTG